MNKQKYFDLQVNGYAGVDFNSVELTNGQLSTACKKLYQDNVQGILATIITDDFDGMVFKIKNLSNLISKDKFISSIIKGIHIEGPFLNPEIGYCGAHPKEFIIPSNQEKTKLLLESGNGLIKLFTLAPEYDTNFESIKYLSNNKVTVSAGHTNASMDHLLGALDNGLKMFTHLGNGSPNILPRHDNIINRVLSLCEKMYICFIADGIHIPNFVLKNYLKLVRPERCIIVTDAMSAASAPPGRYSVSHINVEVGEDRTVREVGKENLAGSAVTMKESAKFLSDQLDIYEKDLMTMMYYNPKRAINFI